MQFWCNFQSFAWCMAGLKLNLGAMVFILPKDSQFKYFLASRKITMYHYYNITIKCIPFCRTPLTRTRNCFADIHFLRLVKHSSEREWLWFCSCIIAFQSYNITIGFFCILSVRGANSITGLHLFTIFLLMRMHIEMGIESRKSDSRRLPVCYYLPNEYSTYCAN